ncbi:MAG: cytochrome c oxidase subunit 3 [Acidimicrobiales bacterium]
MANLVLFAAVTGVLGGMWFWSTKIGGRQLPGGAGRLVALCFVGGGLLLGGAQVVNGLFETSDNPLVAPVEDAADALNTVSLIGVLVIGLGVLGLLGAVAAACRANAAPTPIRSPATASSGPRPPRPRPATSPSGRRRSPPRHHCSIRSPPMKERSPDDRPRHRTSRLEVVRPRTVLVGAMFASAAAMMTFLGVVAVYLAERADARHAGAAWFKEGALELGPPGFVLATLILSIVTVQWAVSAINHGDRTNTLVALGLTGVFGAAVFNQLWFVINDTGFAVAADTAQFLFFLVNGTFLVFLIGAVVFLAVSFLRALLGQFGPHKADSIAAAAFFWNTVVAMWSIAWYVVYVTK